MDFVTRHSPISSSSAPTTASSDQQHHRPETASSPSSNVPHVAEEPEYLARYLVVKHSWRGRYKRILCLSNVAIITLDPSTLSVTNSYDVGNDFDVASPILGRDENSFEFNLNVRTDGKGKFKSIKFSSRYRASILTELHRIKGIAVGAVAEYPVLHLRRRNSDWVPYVSFLVY